MARLKQQRGAPRLLFCDNGSEFTSQAMDLWAYQNEVKIDFPGPGNPRITPSWNRSMGPSEPNAWTHIGS
jgi:transposase InsO family protein